MITGNRGEWSEIYTLFKLLADQNLFSGDANLNKIESLFYPIIKIIRTETGGNYEYALTSNLIIITGGEIQLKIPVEKFSEQAAKLLAKIKKSKGTFSIPETERFMEYVNCHTLKAKSSLKSDIKIVIHDRKINQKVELGFSIKSQLGGNSTLLNAGKTTNFIYKINGFTGANNDILRINNINTKSKIKDRIEEIKRLGGNLNFISLNNKVFQNNLILIDSLLPNILAELARKFFSSNLNTIIDLTNYLNEVNPLNYDTQSSHIYYEYKIKRFLTDVSLGMMPSKVWSGEYDATGGYLVVKENGDILCYHIYNKHQFEDYLFKSTKLETASSERHQFGSIYMENENLYLKLNLQIRFI